MHRVEPDPNDLLVQLKTYTENQDEATVEIAKGPWVFGLDQDIRTVRFIIIPDRAGDTLISTIEKYVLLESIIVSDEWAGYNRLEDEGCVHECVCHKRNYVNSITGIYTQAIERA